MVFIEIDLTQLNVAGTNLSGSASNFTLALNAPIVGFNNVKVHRIRYTNVNTAQGYPTISCNFIQVSLINNESVTRLCLIEQLTDSADVILKGSYNQTVSINELNDPSKKSLNRLSFIVQSSIDGSSIDLSDLRLELEFF